jgi:hypothetical protein
MNVKLSGREIASSHVEELYPANLLPEKPNWTTNSASRVKSDVHYHAHKSPPRSPVESAEFTHCQILFPCVSFYYKTPVQAYSWCSDTGLRAASGIPILPS